MSTSDACDALPNGYSMLEYRIESTLGVGGFGVTYLAHDTNLNTKVALKEYLPSTFARRGEDNTIQPKSKHARESFEWGLKRFLDEARTLASFRHPNIVRVMRFFEANSTAYMVMEFIAGKPLVRTNLDQAGLLRIAMPLLDGLEVIHQTGYLHRDIKPPNIFIRNDGSPILIDFGSARMSAAVNQEMTAIVSPGFSPLEQYHTHGKQGPWTDIYSFAGVLYWLVTGKKPFEAAARVHQDAMPPAAEAGNSKYYSKDFLKAIDWGLKPLERDRPQTVAQWRVALVGTDSVNIPTIPLNGGKPAAQPVAEDIRAAATIMPTGAVIDRDTLIQIQSELAKYLGPIAGTMVRNAARKAVALRELVALLAPEFDGERARSDFTRKFNRDESMPTSQLAQRMPATSTTTSMPSEYVSASLLQRFDPVMLRRVETLLARHIGPFARIVIVKACRKATTLPELATLLASEIADEQAQAAFIKHFNSDTSMPTSQLAQPMQTTFATSLPSKRVGVSALRGLDPETLLHAEKELARHLGAIARIVVKRAAQRARDESELYLLLSAEIADKAEREKFVRSAMSYSNRTS